MLLRFVNISFCHLRHLIPAAVKPKEKFTLRKESEQDSFKLSKLTKLIPTNDRHSANVQVIFHKLVARVLQINTLDCLPRDCSIVLVVCKTQKTIIFSIVLIKGIYIPYIRITHATGIVCFVY